MKHVPANFLYRLFKLFNNCVGFHLISSLDCSQEATPGEVSREQTLSKEALKLFRWPIVQCGMKPLAIIDLHQKMLDIGTSFFQRLIIFEGNLFGLDGFHEALSLGILVGITRGCHADAGSNLAQASHRGMVGIWNPLIRMVNESWLHLPTAQGHL